MSQASKVYSDNVGSSHEFAVQCVWDIAFQEGINSVSRPSVAASYAAPVIPDVPASPEVVEALITPAEPPVPFTTLSSDTAGT